MTFATLHMHDVPEQDISFSGDSRWVGFTTTHGTTHIYAICPWGGVPTPHTHVPDVIENLKVAMHGHIALGICNRPYVARLLGCSGIHERGGG